VFIENGSAALDMGNKGIKYAKPERTLLEHVRFTPN
jgi:hypothetical protein